MGALSFAMDTLATLSSVLAPTKGNRNYLDLSSLEFTLDDIAQRAFDEFATGMKMLHKHGARNACDISAITQQNIKLLHSNLKASPNYRNTLSLIHGSAGVMMHRTWLPLLDNHDLSAGLLYLAPGNSSSPSNQDTNTMIHQDTLHGLETNATQIYFSIMGQTQIHFRTTSLDSRTNTITLKKGGAFAEDPLRFTVDQLISQKETLLLNIRFLHQ